VLDLVVIECGFVIQWLATKLESLVWCGDAYLSFALALDIGNGIGWFDIQRQLLALVPWFKVYCTLD
jgi:hypothetical protein